MTNRANRLDCNNNFLRFWKAVNLVMTDNGLPEMLYADAKKYFEFSGMKR
jgi:hypothetical protein